MDPGVCWGGEERKEIGSLSETPGEALGRNLIPSSTSEGPQRDFQKQVLRCWVRFGDNGVRGNVLSLLN